MKLTTKIIIGIISFIFFFFLIFIIGFSFSDRVNYISPINLFQSNLLEISQQNKLKLEVGEYKTILIEKEPEERPYPLAVMGKICLVPATEENPSNTLILSEELSNYSTINPSNDTLKITLKIKDIHEKYRSEEGKTIFIKGLNFQIPTSENIDLICTMGEINTEIKEIVAKEIKVETSGKLLIESCHATIVQPLIKDHQSLEIKNTKIKELKMNLDYSDILNFNKK